MLKKTYSYAPAPAASEDDAAKDTPDENGITEKMIDFDWERDIKIGVCVLCFVFRIGIGI